MWKQPFRLEINKGLVLNKYLAFKYFPQDSSCEQSTDLKLINFRFESWKSVMFILGAEEHLKDFTNSNSKIEQICILSY